MILINPDNPSGNYIKKSDVFALVAWCEQNNIRFVLDESFVDFSDEGESNTLIVQNVLQEHPSLLVVKSISKSYGVPSTDCCKYL